MGIARRPLEIDKNLGSEWDLVFKLEHESGLSVELIGSIFEAGRAFGAQDSARSHRTYLELSYDF